MTGYVDYGYAYVVTMDSNEFYSFLSNGQSTF